MTISSPGSPALLRSYIQYDDDGSGNVDFYEMVRNILPKDYPVKSWSAVRGEQMAAEEMRRLMEGKRQAREASFVPNMSIMPSTARRHGPRTHRSPGARAGAQISRQGRGTGGLTHRGQSPGTGRAVSRAVAARLNAIERVKSARRGTPRGGRVTPGM